MRIIIIRQDHLGDLILTTPLIRSLAKAGHQVDVLARKAFTSLFDNSPYARCYGLEDVVPLFPKDWRALAFWLKSRRYDVVILPHAKPRALLLASALSGAPIRLAMWGGIVGRLLNHRCLRSGMLKGTRHFSDIMLDFARILNICPAGLRPDLSLTQQEIIQARAALQARWGLRPVVMVHPGDNGNACNTSPATYAQLVRLLLERTAAAVVITGVKKEQTILDPCFHEVWSNSRVWSTFGLWTVRELAAYMACCRVVVVGSTGPLHLASALDIPSVSPFCRAPALGPNRWGSCCAHAVVIHPPADHCHAHRKNRHSCHLDQWIKPETLFQGVQHVLQS